MKRTTDKIMEDFIELACSLSPENLYCDGELTSELVEESLKALNEDWKKLEEELGYTVTATEAWDYERHQREQLNANSLIQKKKNFFGKSN